MSASLRDVCVGLVELAHPDMRISAVTDISYKTMWAHCFKVRLASDSTILYYTYHPVHTRYTSHVQMTCLHVPLCNG